MTPRQVCVGASLLLFALLGAGLDATQYWAWSLARWAVIALYRAEYLQ